MNRKILPMRYPPITSYQPYANMLSVLINYPETEHWIYSHFIQMKLVLNDDFHDISRDVHLTYTSESDRGFCPFIHYQALKREILELVTDDFVGFFVRCLQHDHYVKCIVDLSKIEGTQSYGGAKNPHEFFIYGYDLERQVFHVAEFDFTGRYSFEITRFDQFDEAFRVCAPEDDYVDGCGVFQLWSKQRYRYEFNAALVADTLEDYLHSRNTVFRSQKMNDNDVYGLAIYPYMEQYFRYLFGQKNFADTRILHNLYDRKRMMNLRLDYMERNGYLRPHPRIRELYGKMEQMALHARNTAIKYNITQSRSLTGTIFKYLDEFPRLEEEAIRLILEQMA